MAIIIKVENDMTFDDIVLGLFFWLMANGPVHDKKFFDGWEEPWKPLNMESRKAICPTKE